MTKDFCDSCNKELGFDKARISLLMTGRASHAHEYCPECFFDATKWRFMHTMPKRELSVREQINRSMRRKFSKGKK